MKTVSIMNGDGKWERIVEIDGDSGRSDAQVISDALAGEFGTGDDLTEQEASLGGSISVKYEDSIHRCTFPDSRKVLAKIEEV